jgi:hypothetical protein
MMYKPARMADKSWRVKLPSGYQIAAGRALAGLDQRALAAAAKVSPATIARMEGSGPAVARAHARNVESVLQALERHGVRVTASGVERIEGRKP